jgi:uncharacterized protein HemX
MKSIKLFLLVTLLFLMNNASVLAQCAMCKGSVETNKASGPNVIANGINTGIAYLFIFPYLALGLVGYLWYRNSKKQLQHRLALQARVREAYQKP